MKHNHFLTRAFRPLLVVLLLLETCFFSQAIDLNGRLLSALTSSNDNATETSNYIDSLNSVNSSITPIETMVDRTLTNFGMKGIKLYLILRDPFRSIVRDPSESSLLDFNKKPSFSEDALYNLAARIITTVNPFRKLGLYDKQGISSAYFAKDTKGFSFPKASIPKNPYYCDIVDMYHMMNPSLWLDHKSLFTDYGDKNGLWGARTWLKEYGEVSPKFRRIKELKKYHAKNWFPYNVSSIISFYPQYYIMGDLGLNYLCNTQAYGFFAGHESLSTKLGFTKAVSDYTQKYQDKPSCFVPNHFFPPSYILNDAAQCAEFFKAINSAEYALAKLSWPIQYLIKISKDMHQGYGVSLLADEEEVEIRQKYMDGSLCGKIPDDLIAQKYITNPLLLDDIHKFDFRVPVFVASTDPLIVFYHDGFLRVSLQDFNMNSTDKRTHLTNVHVSKSIIKAEKDAKERAKLRSYQLQLFSGFQEYLLEKGLIDDDQWLENYLRPAFHKALAHIFRMTGDNFVKRSGTFRLFGVDFMMDTDLKIWFIEANKSPQIFDGTPEVRKFTEKMFDGMVDIIYALLRSRLTRVREFMLGFVKDYLLTDVPYNKEEMKQKYLDISKDKFDEKFPLKQDNSWQVVMDMSLGEEKGYFGHIDPSCYQQ